MVDLIRVSLGGQGLQAEVSLVLVAAGAVAAALWLLRRRRSLRLFRPVEVEIRLGGVGQVKLQPNVRDVQIAHKLWVELVTRKAAVPLDEEHDVILEIYDSWHTLFQNVRTLLGEVPAELIRTEPGTREIVRIATATLNEGLRPHLTRWHARLQAWCEQTRAESAGKSPQEWQRHFPEYAELVADLKVVSQQLVEYAGALARIVRGE